MTNNVANTDVAAISGAFVAGVHVDTSPPAPVSPALGVSVTVIVVVVVVVVMASALLVGGGVEVDADGPERGQTLREMKWLSL